MTKPLETLPYHLGLSILSWGSLNAALQLANSGLQSWNPPFHSSSAAVGNPMTAWMQQALADPALVREIQRESLSRLASLVRGVSAYHTASYRRALPEPPVVWQRGNARLLDYGSGSRGDAPPVFFVPSLINRYYILDLSEQRSLLRYLASVGFHPYVMDWGEPGAEEQQFHSEPYITHYLVDALHTVSARHRDRKVALAGYCMGGLFALALAQLVPERLSSLAVLATPWDFHSNDFPRGFLTETMAEQIDSLLKTYPLLPSPVIQLMFYSGKPWLFQSKFGQFSAFRPESPEAREFVELENWVNDGVPMAGPLARECLIGWAHRNQPARGEWRVAGTVIDPRQVRLPTLIATPRNDHIVPIGSAVPLASAIPGASLLTPSLGHVSMVVGERAREELWQPLSSWLERQTAMTERESA